jgi:hypothetical protein
MKRMMIISAAVSLLLFISIVPMISEGQMATQMQAAQHITATGAINAGIPTFTGEKTVGKNTFITGTFDEDIFTGTLSGTAPNEFRLVLNPSGMYVQILFSFTGTVDGRSGTMTIMFLGHGEGIGLPIQGIMVILSGTGDLAHLHGVLGVDGIAGVYLDYTGMLYFDSK